MTEDRMREDHAEDEALLAELRALAGRLDPVPPHVDSGARATLTWRTVDAELAELASDSVLDAALDGVRGPEGSHLVTFESSGLTLDLEITVQAPGRHRIVGQVVPPQCADVEIRHRQGLSTQQSDDLGRFIAEDIPAGPVSLRCRPAQGGAVDTDWMTL